MMNSVLRPLASVTAALATLALTDLSLAESAAPEPGQLLGGKQTTYPGWFKDSFLEFEDDVLEAAENGRRVILFFHQDNCPYCNALVERNLSQKQIEDKIRGNFDVIALNLRGDRDIVSVDGTSYSEKDFARALDIQFTPTLLFLDEDGGLVLRLNGYVPPPEFEAALDFVAQKLKARGISYRDYVSSVVTPGGGGELIQEPFFSPPPHDFRATSGRPMAVFFEQRQCPGCDELHREILADEDTARFVEPFYAVQLDMWSDQVLTTPSGEQKTAREWARDLDIQYAPTIVLFSRDSEEIIRSEAGFKRFHTQSILDYVASGAYETEPDFQRFLTERADRIMATGQDVDIWK